MKLNVLSLFWMRRLLVSDGHLLAEAVERAETPDDVGAVDANYFAVGEAFFEDIGGACVVVAFVSREDDQAVADVEVGVGGW